MKTKDPGHFTCLGDKCGVYSPPGSATCLRCEGNRTYQDEDGQSECKVCSPGLMADPYDAQCICAETCAPGTYLEPVTIRCLPCPAGTYAPSYGAITVSACLDCPRGNSGR